MTVWMYVDEYSSWSSQDRAEEYNDEHEDGPRKTGRDLEYEEIETAFRREFPDQKIYFYRDKVPSELRNGYCDYYVWDIGGMCYVDPSGTKRHNWCSEVLRHIEDRPDTTFVPWSMFTQDYTRCALEDLIGEAAFDGGKFPPNLIVLAKSEINFTSDVVGLIKQRLRGVT